MCPDLGAAPLATADPKGIEELADMLAGAKNPVIIAEDSGRTAKGVECLVEIAELLGCPVVETRAPERSIFRGPIRCTAASIPKKWSRAAM